MTHPLITAEQRALLLANGAAAEADADFDPPPVVKLFTPDANATWLLAWLDPAVSHIGFALCDLGMGCPEMGSVDIGEIASVRSSLNLPVERDRHSVGRKPLSAYATQAHRGGAIVTG